MFSNSSRLVTLVTVSLFLSNGAAFAQLSHQSVKDRSVKQIDVGAASDSEKKMRVAVAPYSSFADNVVEKLKKGDLEFIMSALNPQVPAAQARKSIAADVLPYFKDYKADARDLTVCIAQDTAGNHGFSFYDFFETAAGEKKPFMLAIVKQGDRLVISTLMVGKGTTFKERYPDGNDDIVCYREQSAEAFLGEE